MFLKLLPLFLIFLVGCATKIRTPLNRLMAAESVGGSLNTEVQLAQANSAQGRFDVSSSAPYPLVLSEVETKQYFTALSLLPSLDVYWNYFTHSNSLFGFRYQFIGNSQTSNPQGYSLGATLALGSNEHETESDPKLNFKLGGRDFSLIHSYWPWSFLGIYQSVFYSKYELTGNLSSGNNPALDAAFNQTLTHLGTNVGAQIKFMNFNFKVEYCYNRLKWSESSSKDLSSLGLALGAAF